LAGIGGHVSESRTFRELEGKLFRMSSVDAQNAARHQSDIVEYRQMREQIGLLEHNHNAQLDALHFFAQLVDRAPSMVILPL
jgi:hypothetical protein